MKIAKNAKILRSLKNLGFGVLFSVIAEKVLRIGARSEKQGAAWLLYPDE